jgi:hypothetical protein
MGRRSGRRAAVVAWTMAVLVAMGGGSVATAATDGAQEPGRAEAGSAAVVYATPNADGRVVDLLRERFRIVRLGGASAHRALSTQAQGVVAASEDLSQPLVAAFVRDAYDRGLTVGVLDAGPVEAEALRQAVGREAAASLDGPVQLLAIREDRSTNRILHRTHQLEVRAGAGGSSDPDAGSTSADRREGDYLERVFQNEAVAGWSDHDGGVGDDPDNELTELASSIVVTSLKSDSYGDTVSMTNEIWSMRSFDQSKDFYFVSQTVNNQSVFSIDNIAIGAAESSASNSMTDPAGNPTIVQMSPNSVGAQTSYTTSTSYGLTTNAGFMGANDVFGVTPSMSVTDSKTIMVPETEVTNDSDLTAGAPKWSYLTCAVNSGCLAAASTSSYTQQWIWDVDLDLYAAAQTHLQFDTDYGGKWMEFQFNQELSSLSGSFSSTVPLPFDSPTLADPVVDSVDVSCQKPGSNINVTGDNFYYILAVQIGGNDATSYQVQTKNTTTDEVMTVTVPGDQTLGNDQQIVVQTGVNISMQDVTIDIKKSCPGGS